MSVTSVRLERKDFQLIQSSLEHSYGFWRGMCEKGEYPNGFDENRSLEICHHIYNLIKKVESIVTMEPNTIGNENYEKIMNIIDSQKNDDNTKGNPG